MHYKTVFSDINDLTCNKTIKKSQNFTQNITYASMINYFKYNIKLANFRRKLKEIFFYWSM